MNLLATRENKGCPGAERTQRARQDDCKGHQFKSQQCGANPGRHAVFSWWSRDQGFDRRDALSYHITHQLVVLGDREFSEAAIQLKIRPLHPLIILLSEIDALRCLCWIDEK